MASLTRYGTEVGSAFSLLGQNENDLTAALGFTMARCTALSDAILRRVWPTLGEGEDISFALEVRAEIGRTDLEVRLPSALVIFEAKRDWLLPTKMQLAQYVSREKAGHSKDAKDYFLAGKALPWWAIGASLIAANISAEQIIGMSGSGYAIGLAIASYEWMAAATLLIVASSSSRSSCATKFTLCLRCSSGATAPIFVR